MGFAVGIFLCLLSAPSAQGQIIEFDPPQEIVVDESRLIITFEDSVSLDAAQDLVETAGAEVLESTFRSVTVFALLDGAPEPDPLIALRSDRRIHAMSVLPPSAAAGVWVQREDGSRRTADYSTHALQVEFAPGTPDETVMEVMRAYYPDLELRVARGPNELVVQLPDEAEGLAAAIEADPRVRYVTYFSVDDTDTHE